MLCFSWFFVKQLKICAVKYLKRCILNVFDPAPIQKNESVQKCKMFVKVLCRTHSHRAYIWLTQNGNKDGMATKSILGCQH